MTNGIEQLLFYCLVLTALSYPLGIFIAGIFSGKLWWFSKLCISVEEAIAKICGINIKREMTWFEYCQSLLTFSVISAVGLYLLQRLQDYLPGNPQGLSGVPADLALNASISFVSNTNWQSYGGESSMSYLTQMLGLSVQNFLSAATGIAVLFALIRGIIRTRSNTLGNFWSDIIRICLQLLLPLSIIFSIVLVSQGVVQTYQGPATVELTNPVTDSQGADIKEQQLALGPVASQIAIKQLGTNGGGFYNANSAHPFENPTPLSNFLELLSILLIAGALCFTFGSLVSDQRQGWALYSVMMIILVCCHLPTLYFESQANPALSNIGISTAINSENLGLNLEGKEVRHGLGTSVLWAIATTAASNGSVNAMHDSFMPLAGLFPMLLMQLGEVVFGGVGSGLHGMVAFVIVAVFVAGLMVGRTPEYLGKKISSYEMKMVSLIVLTPCILVLLGTSISLVVPSVASSITNPGPHGLSQALYAYSSMANNNGSAFAGFSANVPLHNLLGAAVMWISRFFLIIFTLALAGSLGKKNKTAISEGTLPTHTPLFAVLMLSVILVVGALTFFPALALGPIVEHLQTFHA